MRKALLLALFISMPCLGDYSWHATTGVIPPDAPGKYSNADLACRAAVAMQFYKGEKKYIKHEITGSGNKAVCHVQLKSCKTCPWVTPTPPNRINGYGMQAMRWGKSCDVGKAYDMAVGECFSNRKDTQGEPYAACSTPSDKKGNPISILSGNKFQKEVYYKGSGPLEVSLFYNSLDGVWRHNYYTRLHVSQQSNIVVFPDGHSIEFDKVSGAPISGSSPARLEKNGAEWLLSLAHGKTIHFNEAGRMTRIKGSRDTTIELTYASLVFSSNPSNSQPYVSQVIKVKSGSQEITLTEIGQVPRLFEASIGGEILKFVWNKSALTRANITNSAGDTLLSRHYLYESSYGEKYLTGIIDELGNRYATWNYDSNGRAVSSEHFVGADKVLVDYISDSVSAVTNPLGQRTIYHFADFNGTKRITLIQGEPSANCPNSNSSFTYDDRGLLKTKIDNKGHLTTYDYNDRGLEVSRTEAAGTPQARTVTTDWHPTLFLPVTVTEPSRITTYTYDDQGRQLSQSVTQR